MKSSISEVAAFKRQILLFLVMDDGKLEDQ
jgi:hypothetical protein